MKLDEGCNKLGLTINENKSKFMWFATHTKIKKCMKKPTVKISGRSIKRVMKFTYLGAVFDETLSFKQRAKKCLNQVNLLKF